MNHGSKFNFKLKYLTLNPLSANPTKWKIHSNNSPAKADELFECVLTILWGWRKGKSDHSSHTHFNDIMK